MGRWPLNQDNLVEWVAERRHRKKGGLREIWLARRFKLFRQYYLMTLV